ncbi:hypothetical protein MKW92_028075 [Papaver armeniacum]|nr:hypothetical protein MKW92_028075 [Papaver armeniacum]
MTQEAFHSRKRKIQEVSLDPSFFNKQYHLFNRYGYASDSTSWSGDLHPNLGYAADPSIWCGDLVFGEQYCRKYEDVIHGNISVDPLAMRFVNTYEFQRLNTIKQLGVAYFVFDTDDAKHSRFDHSLGVYWLASNAVNKLKANQGLELGIEGFDIQTVKLAGLLHDVGHGPYSHVFEQEFLPLLTNVKIRSHKEMSVKLVDYIIDKHNIDIDPGTIKRVKDIIVSGVNTVQKSGLEKKFLYDIVANRRTGIDVDMLDYIARDDRAVPRDDCAVPRETVAYRPPCSFGFERLIQTMRVIGDETCYSVNDYPIIKDLFATRANIHRELYTEARVKAAELMFVDVMLDAGRWGDICNLVDYLDDPEKYCQLRGTLLEHIVNRPYKNVMMLDARRLIYRLESKRFYQLCNEYVVPNDRVDHFKVTAQDIVCSQIGGELLKEQDVAVSNVKIDFSRGEEKPLESVKFFQDCGSNWKFPLNERLPGYSDDTIVRVYAKQDQHAAAISQAFQNFLRRTH